MSASASDVRGLAVADSREQIELAWASDKIEIGDEVVYGIHSMIVP
jgi:hypothetical protein